VRITIDNDSPHEILWLWSILKGMYFFKKLPDKIRRTERGIHIVWYNVKTRNPLVARKVVGDDKKRIELDILSKKRITQVLFTEKITTTHGYIHPAWFKHILKTKSPSPHFDVCPCGKKVIKARKVWTYEKKAIEVFHKDGVCEFPLEKKGSVLLNALSKLGVEII